ncbi:Transposase and inactivated derivatives [Serratia fonticola]|nr:Transposase and inactivated derivatives [Serratia fonticola]
MFTEAERIRAIELYFKYGRKLAPVVRDLGYPSKRNLRRWIRLWEASGGVTETIRRKPRYSDVQKQAAVEHYLNHGCCLAFTTRTLGYPCCDVLARWVNELHPDRRLTFTSTINQNAPFEPKLKRQAVMALCTRRVSAGEIARNIGVSRTVLYKWKDEIIGNGAYQAMRKHKAPSPEEERDALREEIARLNQEIQRQQMELDILKKAKEIIKKDPGISVSTLTNREKTKIVDALRETHPLAELLSVLALARSSYFYHRVALRAGDKYVTVRGTMAEIFNGNYRCYGYRRLHAMLRQEGLRLSEKVVRRLMAEEQLVVSRSRRQWWTASMAKW